MFLRSGFGSIVIVSLNFGMTLHSGMNATVLFAAKLPVDGKEMVKFAIWNHRIKPLQIV